MFRHHSLGLIFLSCLSVTAHAVVKSTDPVYRDVRWLARGNTGIALVDDESSLFYNPAGLGFQRGFKLSILNGNGGTGQDLYSSASDVSGLGSSSKTLSQQAAPFLGSNLAFSAGTFPHVVVPYFGFGFWSQTDGTFMYQNPVSPELRVRSKMDYGILAGGAIKLHPKISFGVSIRYQKRRYIAQRFTGGSILTTSVADLAKIPKFGEAWAVNTGLQARESLGKFGFASLGVAIEDLGDTKFRGTNSSKLPPSQAASVNAGGSLGFSSEILDLALLSDFRQITTPDVHITKKIFLGAEVSFLATDVRVGLYQGYWTAGLGFRFVPLFDLNLTTFGEELGYVAGQRENRVYMIGISSAIGLSGKDRGKKEKRYRKQLDAL
jgi:hypothetical protein